jgi:hypothetical protein
MTPSTRQMALNQPRQLLATVSELARIGLWVTLVNLGICCQPRDVVAHTLSLVEATTLRKEMA